MEIIRNTCEITICEKELILTWFKNCVVTARVYREKFVGDGDDDNPQFAKVHSLTKSTFKITYTKLELKSGFKRTVEWKKYRSQMTI